MPRFMNRRMSVALTAVITVAFVSSFVVPAFSGPSPLAIAKKALKSAEKANKRALAANKRANQALQQGGQPGAQGPQGAAGPQGATGLQGAPGSDAQFNGAAAGGDLAGTYPNPTVGANAITGAEILDGTLGQSDSFRLAGNVTVDPPNVGGGACDSSFVTVTGAPAGSKGLLFPTGNFAATNSLMLYTYRDVNFSDRINYVVCNVSATASNAALGNWGFLVTN